MKTFVLPILFIFCSLSAEEANHDIARISEAFGHTICHNLKRIDVKFDMARLLKGIQDADDGKESPMAEKECIQAIECLQKDNLARQSEENLKQAEAFLNDNAKKKGVISLEGGKVQYRIVNPGHGIEVQVHSTPLIRYTVTKLDGSLLVATEEEESETICLADTIPGLKAGLMGMKEGEKRIVFVHPDLAYGNKGALHLPPNVILEFTIEVLKADTK